MDTPTSDSGRAPVRPQGAPEGPPAIGGLLPITGEDRHFTGLPELLASAAVSAPKGQITFIGDAEPLRWTYPELLERAERVCGGLRGLGLLPGARIVILLRPAEELLPALWGCLLGGFVPLVMEVPVTFEAGDHAYDQARRVCEMLGEPRVVVSAENIASAATLTDASSRALDLAVLAAASPAREHHRPELDELAFLCFSSGSTGIPKCIMLTHRCVILRNAGANQHNDHRPDDVNLGWLPFDHIGSVTEHIRSVMLGCDLVYVDKDPILEDPLSLLDVIDRHRVTHTWGPNFIYALIAEALANAPDERRWDLSCVRFLISGGEAASHEAMRIFLERTSRFGFPSTGFRPSFGMVELSAGVTYFAPTPAEPLGFVWLARAGIYGERVEQVAADHPGAKPYGRLGRPIAGSSIRILDRDGAVVPEGVVGRVQFGGAAVAAGYLDNPELSARVFLDGGWLETEDLGFLIDGELVLTGRIKEMLVIHGVNYYSRELEDIVESIEGVERSFTAACAVTSTGVGGERESLALFFSPKDDDDDRDDRDAALAPLLRRVREALVRRARANPSYLVPLARDAIPKTPIGKIQRLELARRFERGEHAAALARVERALAIERAEASEAGAAQTPLQALLVEAWTDILGVPLGIHDNFFALGGDSIKAASVVHRLAGQVPGTLRPASLFDAPTVAELAAALEAEFAASGGEEGEGLGPSGSPLAPFMITPDLARRHEPFPLTDIQQAYWAGRSRAFELGGRSVHSYTELESCDLDLPRLERAWQGMVARHEMLRTVIASDGTQRILETTPAYRIEVEDLRTLANPPAAARLRAIRERMSHQVLPCETWPTFELRAARLADGRTRLFMSLDALFLDARSNFILLHELHALYRDPETALPPLELSLRDYVLQEQAIKRSPHHAEARAHWLARLDQLPGPPELPLAVLPSSLRTPRFVELHHELPREVWRRLVARTARAQITPSSLLLAVFADALRPWSKASRFTLNLTAYRRLPLHAQVDDVIGDFSTLLLLAIEAPGDDDFITRARRIQRELMVSLEHAAFSGIELLRELGRRRGDSTRALAPVVFTSVLGDEMHDPDERPYAWLGETVHSVTQTPQIWFDHIAFEEAGRLVCRWNVVQGLFPAGVAEGIFAAYLAHLGRLAEDEGAWQAPWSATRRLLLPPAARAAQSATNRTEAAIPQRLLHAGFLDQVAARPEAPAVIADDRTLDYATLAALASQVAHRLVDLDLPHGQLVAVVLEKGWEQVVAVLGVLLAGNAYLPLAPDLPEARLLNIIDRSGAVAVVTSASVAPLLGLDDRLPLVCVDERATLTAKTAPPPTRGRPEDLAYVIYTSGSSGAPKGVMIDHRGAWNTIADVNQRFAVGPDDRVLALSALTFDLSVYDIFGVLAVGGAIVIPRPSEIREPRRWARLIADNRVTLWNTVPAFMGVLLDYAEGPRAADLATLRLVLLSGDWIPLGLPAKVRDLPARPQVISLGGATEASIWSILHPIEEIDPSWKSIPYGRPMANQSFHVLDDALATCPDWAPGMLYIGGVGVALGYLGDPERSARSFIIHPETGERLYRTGDLGRYVPSADGAPTIEFLGRDDDQVKIQGFRVELGEIEVSLTRHPEVEAALVTARGERHESKQLVAYVVARSAPPGLGERLRRHLAVTLPTYMVPARFVVLDALPLSSNGKVDRGRLPAPPVEADGDGEDSGSGTEKRGDAPTLHGQAATIATIVAEVLDRETIAADTNLFSLGATSIDLMRIVNRIEKDLGLQLSVEVLFDQPTIARIAAAAGVRPSGEDPREIGPLGTDEQLGGLQGRFPAIVDPAERAAFAAAEPGLPRSEGPAVPLPSAFSRALDELRRNRRSQRHFNPAPLALSKLAELLACLRRYEVDGSPKYLYGSAGGLYPVQAYLYVKPGRVDGLAGGYYSYDRAAHRLVRTSSAETLDETIYGAAINRPVWSRAAFAVYLVAQMAAITPLYRDSSLHFAVLEAGLVSQLLEMHAPSTGLGLAQMGHVNFDRIRDAFALDDGHVLVHSLMGGAPAEAGEAEAEAKAKAEAVAPAPLRIEEEF